METKQIKEFIEYLENLQGSQTTDEEIILYRRLRNALDTKLKNMFSDSENMVEVKLSIFDLSVGKVAEAAAIMAAAILEQKYILHEIPDYAHIGEEIEKSAEADDVF